MEDDIQCDMFARITGNDTFSGPLRADKVDQNSATNGHEHCAISSSKCMTGKQSLDSNTTNMDSDNTGRIKQKVDSVKMQLGKRSPSFLDCEVTNNPTYSKKRLLQPKSKMKSFDKNSTSHNSTISNVYSIPQSKLNKSNSLDKNLKKVMKNKPEKGAQLNEYAQYLGLQPTVKFKCRNCCTMSFKSLGMLKEHQRICRSQTPRSASVGARVPSTHGRLMRKLYLCSACGTYYENWNLFMHMREKHNRHICLFCLGMFSKAEKLITHLVMKHNVKERNFDNVKDFFSVYHGSLFLMCCFCDKIYNESDDFSTHCCISKKVTGTTDLMQFKESEHKSDQTCTTHIKSNAPLNEVIQSIDLKLSATKVTEENTDKKSNAIEKSPLLHTEDVIYNSKQENIDRKSNTFLVDPVNLIDSEQTNGSPNQNCKDGEWVKQSSIDELTESDIKTESKCMLIPPLKISIDRLKSENNKVNFDSSVSNVFNSKSIESDVNVAAESDTFSHQNNISNIIPSRPPTRLRRPPKRYDCEDISATISSRKSFDSFDGSKINNVTKTTIYDGKSIENSLINRVPKLTVRVPKDLLEKDCSLGSSSENEDSNEVEENFQEYKENDNIIQAEDSTIQVSKTSPVQLDQSTCDASVFENKMLDYALAGDDVPLTDLSLNKPIDRYSLQELLSTFLSFTFSNCIYCNHARKIAVNGKQLSLHLMSEHRFKATVDSITAEELMPETITTKLKSSLPEVDSIFISLENNSINDDECGAKTFDYKYECFQCYFTTSVHKDLYLHNRKMHQKTILLCVMCKLNFYSYSELICHLCPGIYDSDHEVRFRCCLCHLDSIPSAFRLMVHLRKSHHACDVCLERCINQSKLSNHVWKHKLHHLCYRCGIAYRNKPDIFRHLFWKHGTESVSCKKCLQKKWPHVYHFCIPPNSFVCDECNYSFTKAVALKVHRRLHSGNYPHVCNKDKCDEKFISKKLLSKHMLKHIEPIESNVNKDIEVITKVQDVEDQTNLATNNIKEDTSCHIVDNAMQSTENISKPLKAKKSKKQKDAKDNLLLDVNLPALNLSESDSDDSDSCGKSSKLMIDEKLTNVKSDKTLNDHCDKIVHDIVENSKNNIQNPSVNIEVQPKPCAVTALDDKENHIDDINAKNIDSISISKIDEDIKEDTSTQNDTSEVLDIWHNFNSYQAESMKSKIPLAPIMKHVCESDHDYCIIPSIIDENHTKSEKDSNEKRQKRVRSAKKKGLKSSIGSSTSSSSSSDTDSSCSCGSNCSCSSSSGSSSTSSSSNSESSGSRKKLSGKHNEISKNKGSDVSHTSALDIMALEEPVPTLIPDKHEPKIAESDLETDETDTDEDFYDDNPLKLSNKMIEEKRTQLALLSSVTLMCNGESEESYPKSGPIKESEKNSTKKKYKGKRKKKVKTTKNIESIKINIPKHSNESETQPTNSTKITISLQSNTIQIPDTLQINEKMKNVNEKDLKRASKRRRVPNKFYGYSSDEEFVLKPQLPPKLEWRKEDLPSPTIIPRPQTTLNLTQKNYTMDVIPPPTSNLNVPIFSTDDSHSSGDENALQINETTPTDSLNDIPPPIVKTSISNNTYPFPRPSGFRQAREGESVYCYCRCPYDEVSEMIGCDAEGCAIEWFHFECVGIMVPPKGKWFCPDCRQKHANNIT